MIKKLKPVILILINILLLQSAAGQKQVSVTDNLSQRFIKYCNAVPREEIFVHSDREEYIAGEDLWFNVYLVNRQNLRPSSDSKIAYFELLNPENRPVVQKRIFLEDGFGPGQIIIPDTLSSGTYTIRAYTNWMKNFLPYNYYLKDIKVYNAFSNKAFKEKKSTAGGTVNEQKKEVAVSGVALRVNNPDPNIVEISVDTDERFRNDNGNLFYLFIQTHGTINHVSTEKTYGDNTKITIPKTMLIPGINHISLFNSKGQLIIEKLIYTPYEEKQILTIHTGDSSNVRDKVSLEIEMDNILSSALEATNLSISVATLTNGQDFQELKDYLIFGSEFGIFPGNQPGGKKLSKLSAEAIDSLLMNVKSNWIDWSTILSGKLPDFAYLHEKTDHQLFGKLLTEDQKPASGDEYLLLSVPGKVPVFKYAKTDKDGNFSFNVHIDDALKDLVILPGDIKKKNKIIIGSSFSDKYLQSETSPDTTGRLIPEYISKWSVNYQVMKIYGSSFIGEPIGRVLPQLQPQRFYGKPDVELIMADYIQLPVMEEVFFELLPGVFLKKKKGIYEISIADPIDYKTYETPPGLLVDGVIINDAAIIANLDPEIVEEIDVVKDRYFVGDYPFFGIVNVITKSGDFNNVSLPSYATRLHYRVIEPALSFKSPDYSSPEIKSSRIPDFRNTLYWNPSVKPDKDGKARVEFWSSDSKSDYVINIQGITAEGKPLSIRKIIRVK